MSNKALALTLEQLCHGNHLTSEQSDELFSDLMIGNHSPIEMASVLTALKAKGETADEIIGAVRALSRDAITIGRANELKKKYTIIDCAGTGGDGQHTLNISTAVSIVLACAGLNIAKHGGRAVSSKCGSGDLLEHVGLKLEISPHIAQKSLEEVGMCFLYALSYHPSMRLFRQIRSVLKMKTIINILCPLLNPLQPDYQLIGVYDPKLCHIFAQVLKGLHVKRALIIHGSDLDEIAIHGPTTGVMLYDGDIRDFSLTPEEVGLKRYPLEQIRGGDVATNAKFFIDLLSGKGEEAYRAAVAINAGAALYLVGKVDSIQLGVETIQAILNTNQGYLRLEHLIRVSHAN